MLFSVSMYFTGILSSGRCIVLFSSQFNSLQALTAGPHVDCKRACALFVLELQHSVASSDMGLAVCGRVCWHTPPYSDVDRSRMGGMASTQSSIGGSSPQPA